MTFNWTAYPNHGPGTSFLGAPRTALDLGCGTGRNIAHLATKGVTSVGIDASYPNVHQARRTWHHLLNNHRLTLHHHEPTCFLTQTHTHFDAIYSTSGALCHTDPDALLPLIATRLTPGGVLAFSQQSPTCDCRTPGRWTLTPDTWRKLLTRHGFTNIRDLTIPAPNPGDSPTLLITARTQARPPLPPSPLGTHTPPSVTSTAYERGLRGRGRTPCLAGQAHSPCPSTEQEPHRCVSPPRSPQR